VYVGEHLVTTVAEVNNTLGIAGHRGDLAILKTARALAALSGGVELSATYLRDAIRLRVLHDQSTEQVCQALQISEENLFVRLHRARKQLLS
jgi:DNA-directed RNA polymerase specialized sigma24 family protein